jgi:hypothetical protein
MVLTLYNTDRAAEGKREFGGGLRLWEMEAEANFTPNKVAVPFFCPTVLPFAEWPCLIDMEG